MSGANGAAGQASILNRHVSACTAILGCICYYIQGCVGYYVACTTLLLALVYRNILEEVRLGGWGTDGPKTPEL